MANAATAVALAIVVISVAWAVLLRSAGVSLYFSPASVVQSGALWEWATYALADNQTMSVLFAALIVWSLGGSLEATWGRARFLVVVLSTPIVAAMLTTGLAFAWPALFSQVYLGAHVTSAAVWTAYGCVRWNGSVNFFGLPVTGRTFAAIGVLMELLNAVFYSVAQVVPVFVAIVLAGGYVLGVGPTGLWVQFQSWRLSRLLKKRSRHLHVVGGTKRNMPPDSDRYLH